MISESDYKKYFGVDTAPSNFKRLEKVAINNLKAVMIVNVPNDTDDVYEDFCDAIKEQIYFLDMNSDLINGASSGGYTLGSYSENNPSKETKNAETINRISPVAYDILLNCGLLYSGLKGRCF